MRWAWMTLLWSEEGAEESALALARTTVLAEGFAVGEVAAAVKGSVVVRGGVVAAPGSDLGEATVTDPTFKIVSGRLFARNIREAFCCNRQGCATDAHE